MVSRLSIQRKLATHTHRTDRIPFDPASRLRRIPPPPRHLSGGAKAEWSRLAPVAHGLGTLTRADLVAFELLCRILDTEREARETVEREGMTVESQTGGAKAHPALKAMEVARNQAERLLGIFGMHPRGRQGIDPAPIVAARAGPLLGTIESDYFGEGQ